MSKGKINACDAFRLLEGKKLYKNQLHDVLNGELSAKKILCISDTTDVLVREDERTTSIAHTIEKAKLGSHIEVIQSDFMDFRFLHESEYDRPESPKFGVHLPQQAHETRREYLKVDATELEQCLSNIKNTDVILGRNCICGCEGNGKLCGGIDISVEAQQHYLETLIDLEPSLVVLSAASAMFFPTDESDREHQERAQLLYKKAKKNMLQVCANLNANKDSPYRFKLIDPDSNLKFMVNAPQNENGYMLVAYDTRKIIFQPTTISLEMKRHQENRYNVSSAALIKQKDKILSHKPEDKNKPNSANPSKKSVF